MLRHGSDHDLAVLEEAAFLEWLGHVLAGGKPATRHERRESGRQALAVELMAGRAILVVKVTPLLQQILLAPNLAGGGLRLRRGHPGLLRPDPGGEFLR